MGLFIVLAFHHRGKFEKVKDNVLQYVDGIVEYMPKLDVDYINIFDIQALFKNLGYDNYVRCFWLKPTITDLATGLRELSGDSDINEMCEAALVTKGENVIHLYFEHHVNVPEILEDLGNVANNSRQGEDDKDAETDINGGEQEPETDSDEEETNDDSSGSYTSEFSGSSFSDDYESAEDELYRPDRREKDIEYEEEGNVHVRGSIKEQTKKSPRVEVCASRKKYVPRKKGAKKDISIKDLSDDQITCAAKSDEEKYEYASEELLSPASSDDESRPIYPQFDDGASYGFVQLALKMKFVNLNQFKNDVKDYNINLGRQFKWLKNEKIRARAKCASEGCDWMICCAWNSKTKSFQIKTMKSEHSCSRAFKNKQADRKWVINKLVKRIRTHPGLRLSEAFDHMKEDYNVHLNMKKIYRSLKKARELVEGTEREQYARLRDYLHELLRSNPGTTAKMEVIPQPKSPPIFQRVYICLDACKKGF